MNYPPNIDPKKETAGITDFIKNTFNKTGKKHAVIAVSGGVDSATSLFLTTKALGPQNITCLFLPAKTTDPIHWEHVLRSCKIARIPQENILTIPIGGIIQKTWRAVKRHTSQKGGEVNKFVQSARTRQKAWQASHTKDTSHARSFADKQISVDAASPSQVGAGIPNRRSINAEFAQLNRLRLANIAARSRMIVIFDQAKLLDALVIGTENQSEHLLGYYTRFGDEASDVEPIRHLYKTQVRQLAKFLKVPKEVIEKAPTAELWAGQTDEAELGFSYDEADPILFLHYEQQKSPKEIVKLLTNNTRSKTKEVEKLMKKVLGHCKQMSFKQNLPYTI
ncbi:MAG: NAD(+) synthase [Candidatus Chisholmbacteria bacterium RIFCSPHIGHO2_01_FULL_49_18]|uniref:NH(3)-dependent NAD(+) synthetase n=2 Tax=Candidatus Chisholmiibacteriota TaxID=1817900 RepID=A0A1G1VMV1_9BACT|nr:MAG: NAD(+) synthase [Candidatus Chisholmbacteria bacterium RIFCSPHIGHO2_01_FULL_49_18]OGY21349.1 MAG: NAD(+) synthase [Candidatus Chisholmbacteria bacterium RIFCSPLOWO2_01_FULL_49_14]